VLAIVAAGMAAGCATAPVRPVFEGRSAVTQDVLVTVENRIFLDVVIYSESPGSRVRLGPVGGGLKRSFKIPKHQRLASTIRLVADPIGSQQSWASEPFAAMPGTEVRWTVHENAAVRALTIW